MSWKTLLDDGVEEGVFGAAAARVGGWRQKASMALSGFASIKEKEVLTPSHRFDLASLTKPLATLLSVERLVTAGLLGVEAELASFLPEWKGEEIRISHLLGHSAGLVAHRPFYEHLLTVPTAGRSVALRDAIRKIPLAAAPGVVTCYSDLGFMLLRMVVEAVAGMPFRAFVEDEVWPAWKVDGVGFLPSSETPVVETGWSDARGGWLRGVVHDDNAAFVGGVDGHAGLFGTVDGVGRLCDGLLSALKEETASPFLKQAFHLPEDPDTRPLGWDRPSGPFPTCGLGFSPHTVGHLGFTGTSIWLDVTRGISVVLLANRVVFPDTMGPMRDFRRRFHTVVMQDVEIRGRV